MDRPDSTILLIEDDLTLSESLCQFLKDHGYCTISAPTAKRGWEMIQSHAPKVCLLDMNLPDGSGLDVLRMIVRCGLPIHVVVMTAFDLVNLRPKDTGGRLAAWMTKPVNPAELLRIVEHALGEASFAGAGKN